MTRPEDGGHNSTDHVDACATRRTSIGEACTSPGDLQNMIPRSGEVRRRAGACRSAHGARVVYRPVERGLSCLKAKNTLGGRSLGPSTLALEAGSVAAVLAIVDRETCR
jgi:hypothetical protein